MEGRRKTASWASLRRISLLCLILLFENGWQGLNAEPANQTPWRLAKALQLPSWLELSGQHRLRYETLDGAYRVGASGGDQLLAFRTTLLARLRFNDFSLTGELLDSRQRLADAGTPLGTDDVDALELLQGHLEWKGQNVFQPGDHMTWQLGRLTQDLGSRRLMARNRYRNTMNSFTGASGLWKGENGHEVGLFYLLPIQRLPADGPSLLGNEAALDQENIHRQFWGVHGTWTKLPLKSKVQAYFLGLNEDDSASRTTRNRRLFTPGLRWSRAPARGQFDFEWESAFQFGQVRATTAPADQRDLRHRAHMHALEAGYTADLPGSPRAAWIYEYASGDHQATDGSSQRFDTLYGARRFAHGPTGIYGAFARSNISSPGYLLQLRPSPRIQWMWKHRFYWLASETDAWTTSGLRDASGSSGSFIGHQVETRLRWDAVPGNLRLELGWAHLFAGTFIRSAPNATGQADTDYTYAQCTFSF